jgi:hypothetical protein
MRRTFIELNHHNLRSSSHQIKIHYRKGIEEVIVNDVAKEKLRDTQTGSWWQYGRWSWYGRWTRGWRGVPKGHSEAKSGHVEKRGSFSSASGWRLWPFLLDAVEETYYNFSSSCPPSRQIFILIHVLPIINWCNDVLTYMFSFLPSVLRLLSCSIPPLLFFFLLHLLPMLWHTAISSLLLILSHYPEWTGTFSLITYFSRCLWCLLHIIFLPTCFRSMCSPPFVCILSHALALPRLLLAFSSRSSVIAHIQTSTPNPGEGKGPLLKSCGRHLNWIGDHLH